MTIQPENAINETIYSLARKFKNIVLMRGWHSELDIIKASWIVT